MTAPALTHHDLCLRAVKWLMSAKVTRCAFAGCEVGCAGGEQPDAIGADTSGYIHLVEVKRSRSDFLRDAKKYHRICVAKGLKAGIGNRRWFFTTPGIIKATDDLGGWGHVELHGKICTIVRGSEYFETDSRGSVAAMVRMGRIVAPDTWNKIGQCSVGSRKFADGIERLPLHVWEET